MLIATIEELQDYVHINKSSTIDNVIVDLNHIERDVIKPLLGPTLYAQLDDWYNDSGSASSSSSSIAGFEELILFVQDPLANLAMEKYVTFNQVQIDNSGVRIIVNEKKKTAFQWQVVEVRDQFRDDGNSGIEALLEYLDENRTTFTAWSESTAYTEFKEFFLTTAKEYQEFFNINSSRATFLSLRPHLKKVEDLYIMSALGDDFFQEMKDAAQGVDDPSSEDQDVIDLIKPALAQLTMADALTSLPAEIKDNGVVINRLGGVRIEKEDAANRTHIGAIKRQAQEHGDAYLNRLVKFLNQNASETLYKTWFDSEDFDSGSGTSDSDFAHNTKGIVLV